MAITNGYSTLALLKAELGIPTGTTDKDSRCEVAVEAASRQIDAHCGRRFWQDATVVAREFFADSSTEVTVEGFDGDISTVTGLIVKADDDNDGTFETTFTITTHFVLLPANAADNSPVWPYTTIRLVDGSSWFPVRYSGRPGVQVTAKFGWPAVPTDVGKACLIQAVQLFKSSDAVFGGLSFGDGGFMRVRGEMNPMAAGLLAPYCLARVA
jgi:hypothetical protein